jgi:hypothetical protein
MNFFRCFTYAKTEAEAVTNVYSMEQIMEFALWSRSHKEYDICDGIETLQFGM